MPELPEVESVRHKLQTNLTGKSFLEYTIYDPKFADITDSLFNRIRKHSVKKILRRGKHLFIQCNKTDAGLHIHMGMTGFLGFVTVLPQTSYLRVAFSMDTGYMYFDDMRKFGLISVISEKHFYKTMTEKLGPDALMDNLSAEECYYRAQKRRCAIHSLLLDQSFLAGLGNIYGCEILFDAGINPLKKSLDLEIKEWNKLLQSTKKILRRAIAINSSTYVNHPSQKADNYFYNDFLRVYRKEGYSCPTCHTRIHRVARQRSIYFCPSCQK